MALDFWRLDHPAEATAVVLASGESLSYQELARQSDALAEAFAVRAKRSLGFLLCRNGKECLAAYLGGLRGNQVLCLLDAEIQPEFLKTLLDTYRPDFIFAPEPVAVTGYKERPAPQGNLYFREASSSGLSFHPELVLLLPTSGSTGSPKLVRLSLQNLSSNARSIVSYLQLTPADRGLTSLPMSYSYGLSIFNSHLLAGGSLLIPDSGFLQRRFWDSVVAHEPSSIAGVPYHYEVMLKMKMLERELPGLKTLTQAGGRLSPDRVAQLEQLSFLRGWKFFVMYGQTEATARIAYLPPELLRDKPGSIGVAIPGGELSLDQDTSELLYAGPNVMLGYAENRSDLAKGDELKGQLRTGDVARRDDDGCYYIVGRLKRFLKVYGKRFSLDEMEEAIARHGCGPVACCGNDDHIVVAMEDRGAEPKVRQLLADLFKIHPNVFRILPVDSLPRSPNQKIDYQALVRQEFSQ